MRRLDDLAELRVALVLEPDVAGVDAVLVERLGACGVFGEQLVADVMEIADQRDFDAALQQTVADVRHGGGGLVAVDGDAHEFGARAGQRGHLPRRRLDVGGVSVCHRLHGDGRAAADSDRAAPSPTRTPTLARRRAGPKSVSSMRWVWVIAGSPPRPRALDGYLGRAAKKVTRSGGAVGRDARDKLYINIL